jgi:hypothetical protein
MVVDTKAIIRKGTTIEQIESAISAKYKDVTVYVNTQDLMCMSFVDGEDSRTMSVSFTNSCQRDDGIAGVCLSLGFWGNSVEIMKYLCETFGGYIDENDCDDKEFYPINFEEYQKGADFTPLDIFKNKVIKEVGYGKLKPVLTLLDEYLIIKNQ